MGLDEQLRADLKDAMKARDRDRTATLRMAIAAVGTLRVAEGRTGEVTDEEVVGLLKREVRKREEAAAAYDQAGRAELADKERRELAVLQPYLPAQMSDDELTALVDAAVAEVGASGPGDLGAVMKAVMPRVGDAADGRRVNATVRARLS